MLAMFEGYRTYIAAAVMVLFAVLNMIGALPADLSQAEVVNAIMVIGGIVVMVFRKLAKPKAA